jgi:hypothetical protein
LPKYLIIKWHLIQGLSAKVTRWFLVSGRSWKPLRSGKEIEALYIQRGIGGGLSHELKELLTEYNITAQQVPVEKLNRLLQKPPGRCIAFISPIVYQKIENIIPEVFEKGEVPLILVLDSVLPMCAIWAPLPVLPNVPVCMPSLSRQKDRRRSTRCH